MSFLQNLRITTKILICIGMMAALTAGVTAFAVSKAHSLADRTMTLVDDPVAGMRTAAEVNASFTEMHQVAYEIAVESTDSAVPALQKHFEELAVDVRKNLVEMKPLIEGRHIPPYQALTTALPAYMQLEQQLLQARMAHRAADAETVLQERMNPVFKTADDAANLLLEQQKVDVAEAYDGAKADYRQVLIWLIGAGVVGIAVIGGLVMYFSRREIVRPIEAVTRVMGALANGDHAVDVEGSDRKDEIGAMAGAVQVFKDAAIEKERLEARAKIAQDQQAKVVHTVATGLSQLSAGDLTCQISEAFPADYEKLRADFNEAVGKLQEAMKVIVVNAEGMTSGAGEISQAADDLSRRTEQQAATLEETAAALDQITATVKRTAEGAGQANSVVVGAKEDAERSGEVVREAVAAMNGIEKSAGEISQIIGVIDEIAFQTNLLALNAGVEAARAGDAGKGFAVVASEVRALAQRSAEAAKEIKALISTSSTQVKDGVELVGKTGEALERIVGQVSEITSLVSEIAASAREQSTALTEVNTAVNQMDQMTQQNAAMVEQSTAASHSLASEAQQLSALVSRFQIGARAAGPSSGRPTEARPGVHRPVESPVATARARAQAFATTTATAAKLDAWEEF